MFCSKCGNTISSDAVYCSYCGSKLKEEFQLIKIGFFPRLFASIIDGIIIGILNTIISIVIFKFSFQELFFPSEIYNSNFLFQIMLNILYYVYFIGNGGQTPGKMALGIKVINIDGSSPSYKVAFIRYLGYYVSTLTLLLGFLWVAIDKDKQGFHDKIAKTYVVKAK